MNISGVLPTGADGPGRGRGRLPSGAPSQGPAGVSLHLPSFRRRLRCARCSLSSGETSSSPHSQAVRPSLLGGPSTGPGSRSPGRSWARCVRAPICLSPPPTGELSAWPAPPGPGRGSRPLEDDTSHTPCDPAEGFTWPRCFTPSSAARRRLN